jgi:hypothetical protein
MEEKEERFVSVILYPSHRSVYAKPKIITANLLISVKSAIETENLRELTTSV